jgi:phytoene synthase
MNNDHLRHAYKSCAKLTRKNALHFYYAFLALPGSLRPHIYSVYSFCHMCDAVADGDLPVEDKNRILDEYMKELDHKQSGQPVSPVFSALYDTIDRFSIPLSLFYEIIDGVRQDLTVNRYDDFESLRRYCYLVASTVGVICTHLFGATGDEAISYAIDLGIALQLTNILRDIKEDLAIDRIYLPQDEMKNFGYTPDKLQKGVVDDSFRALMQLQTIRARGFYESGIRLISLVPKSSQRCLQLIYDLYFQILQKIEKSGYDVFSQRLVLNTQEKLMLLGKVWTKPLSS